MTLWINCVYILSALLFGLGLKMLGSPDTARRGNLVSAVGMFLAVASTLLHHQIVDLRWIAAGVAAGAVTGAIAARKVAMTAMPEMGCSVQRLRWGCESAGGLGGVSGPAGNGCLRWRFRSCSPP